MASVRKEMIIEAGRDHVWAALADFQSVHKRVAPGFVTDSKSDGENARIVTFSNGTSAREILIDRDAKLRRLVYAVVGSERIAHHNASVQVFGESGKRCRLVWVADFLPNDIAPYIDGQMELACPLMTRALAEHG